jgi:hypothetical protein
MNPVSLLAVVIVIALVLDIIVWQMYKKICAKLTKERFVGLVKLHSEYRSCVLELAKKYQLREVMKMIEEEGKDEEF